MTIMNISILMNKIEIMNLHKFIVLIFIVFVWKMKHAQILVAMAVNTIIVFLVSEFQKIIVPFDVR